MYRRARSSIVTPALGRRGPFVGLMAPAALIAIVANPLAAGTVATWSSTASTGAWASISNWNGLVVPGATSGTTNSDTAVFNSASTTTAIVPDPNRNLQNITFDSSAAAYTIGTSNGNALLLTSGGTTQIASTFTGAFAPETVNAPLVLEGNYTLANNSPNSFSLAAGGAISSGVVGTQALTVAGVGFTLITGSIGGGSGTIALVKNGSGQLGLEDSNSFTGGITINAGLISVENPNAINSANAVTFGPGSTGSLALFNNNIIVSGLSSSGGTPIVLNGAGLSGLAVTLTVNNSVADNYGGTLEDGSIHSLSLVKSGSGTLTLSGTSNYSGSTTIDSLATLRGGAANAFSDASAFNVLSFGTLNLGGFSQSIGSLAGSGVVFTTGPAGTDTLTVGSDNTDSTFSGEIIDTNVLPPSGRILALNKVGSGTLTLTGNNAFSGPVNVNGGTLALAGGSLVENVINSATFAYNAGSFNGRLTNMGTANFNAPFFAGNGMENDDTATAAAGVAVTLGGAGLNNQGTFTMNGGTLTLSSSGTNVSAGSINLASSALLNLTGAMLTNSGMLILGGGSVSGSGGTLTNAGSGTIFGTGTISTTFSNSGQLTVGSGALGVSQAFTNSGIIQLTALNSALTGGAITSTGTINGFGSASNSIINGLGGTIEAIGGILSLNGPLQNQSGALLTASSGNKLLVTQGLATNGGTINLAGGIFDNNGHPLSNSATGQISGWGIFRTGGTGLDNNGSITFSGGLTTVNGPLTNEGGKTITVAQNNAIFTGLVTNNASATFNAVNATATFAGGFVNNGNSNFVKAGEGTVEITAAPTLNNGSTLSVTTGTLRFNVLSGTPTIGTGVSAVVSSGATLELAGSVSALANGANRVNITNNSNAPGILVSGTNQQVGNIDGTGTTQVNAGSDLTANHIVQAALVIGGTSKNPGLVTIDASDASGNPLGQTDGFALAGSLTPSGPIGAGGTSSVSLSSGAGGGIDLAALSLGNSPAGSNPSSIPEPSTLALALLAVLGVISAQFARHHFRCQAV